MSTAAVTYAPAGPARRHLVVYDVADASPAAAAAAATALGLPSGEPAEMDLAAPRDGAVVVAPHAVRLLPLPAAIPALLALRSSGPAWRRPPEVLRAWAAATRVAVRLVAAHDILPRLEGTPDAPVAAWGALLDDPVARAAVARLARALPPAGHAVPATAGPPHPAVEGGGTVWAPGALLRAYLDAVADAVARTAPPDPGATQRRPRARVLPWTSRWAEALADPVDPTVPLGRDAEELLAGVAAWQHAETDLGAVLELELVPPQDEADGVAGDEGWSLTFALRGADGGRTAAADVWAQRGPAEQDALLVGLARAARLYPPLARALRTPAPSSLEIGLVEAWTFLDEAAPALADVGVGVVLPPGLRPRTLRVRLRVGDHEGLDAGADVAVEARAVEDATNDEPDHDLVAAASSLSFGGVAGRSGGVLGGLLATFSWEVALGDEVLEPTEFAALVDAAAPLVRWRGRWVRVDPDEVARLRSLSGAERSDVALADAVALALAGSAGADDLGVPGAEPVEVVAAGGVAALLDRLRGAADTPPVPATPDGFVGELRPYQRRGVAWLAGMAELRLGAVLADSMGTGKTVQLIAHLLGRGGTSGDAGGPHLVVCPTSVLGGWERELARFAPKLPVERHHGPGRRSDLRDARGVVVTTYGTLRSDVDVLAQVDWDVVTIDEAQVTKNPATAAARAVRRLRCQQFVAMTGTPLENRLAELWALLDATNPGLLGSQARFARRFATPIEQRRDADAAARLRRLVAPFVLRRTKADVLADLPPKIERTVVCHLTPEQAALYQAAVDRVVGSGALGQGIARRGRILALLTELKQICNHPAQYLREGAAGALGGRSGKLAAARQIVGAAADAGEQVLVFTQYVEMGHLLVRCLSGDLGAEVGFLHGGLPALARDRLVASFQGEDGEAPPVLVISLRAGGTGLNLTAATHVVHYDRWWNPAVEDQATDRAHRIGQTRTVEVHALVTAGTVEERVAALLERKRSLADVVVDSGESWITELDDADLAELVALSDVPVADDTDDEFVASFSSGAA